MKKLLLSFLMLIASVPLWAYVEHDFEYNGIYYTITSTTENIVEIVGTGPQFTYSVYSIPSSVTYNSTTYSVTSIGSRAFYRNSKLTSVTIPSSVTQIGSSAFESCSALTSISIPSSVTQIGNSAFASCSALTSISIPSSVTQIGSSAFNGCSVLTSISIPSSVIRIGSRAFAGTGWSESQPTGVLYLDNCVVGWSGDSPSGTIEIADQTRLICDDAFRSCSDLTGIILPSSLQIIGYGAFNSTGLTELTIPSNVTTIGGSIVYNCTNLKTINYNAANATVGDHSLKNYAFSSCSATTLTIGEDVKTVPEYAFYDLSTITTLNFNAKNCTSYNSPVTTITKLNIGGSVTSIPANTFSECTGLTSVTIPESVTTIGEAAFNGCTALTSVNFNAKNCSSMGSSNNPAFNGCSALKTLNIGENVTLIPAWAFYKCTSLTSVTIGNSVTSIGQSAFQGCTGLTEVTIPDSVISIDSSAFEGCSGLTSVTIGNSVTSIGQSTFQGCTGLTKVTIPDSVTTIGLEAFYGCSNLTSVTIGNSVTSIGQSAFQGCTELTEVTIPDSVISIGSSAFYNCSGLTSVTIGNSVTSIGQSAFQGCTELTEVTIPDSVITIGSSAFYNCSGLTSVTIGNSVTSISTNAFRNCTPLAEVNISDLSAWCKIEFEGYTANPLNYGASLNLNGTVITDLAIPNNITEIKYCAFFGCTSLKSVTIPNSVTSIGSSAFSDCTGLTTVTIPNSVTTISSYAFEGCTGLTTVTIPNSVTTISSHAFEGCTGLTEVTIPNSVTSIGYYAFSGCTAMTSVNFNAANCTSMGSSNYPVFNGCSALKTLNIGENVSFIPAYAFYGCSGLTEVKISDLSSWCKIDFEDYTANPLANGTSLNLNDEEITNLVIPDDITEIKPFAFQGCSSIISLSTHGSVTTIGNNAFESCSGLTSVTLGDAVETIGDAAFSNCSGILVVNSYNTTAPTGAPFDTSVKEGATLNIPASALASYQSTDGWKDFANISEFALNGTYDFETDGIYYRIVSLTDLTVEVVAKDGNYNSYSGDITIPGTTTYRNREFSVIGISPLAFNGSTGLTSITIPQTVNTIGSKAFEGCSALKTVTIAESDNLLTTNNCFANKSITSLSLGRNITGTFAGNDGLVSIKLSEAITTINDEMFLDCVALTEITLTDSIASIGAKAFSGCAKLQAINIPAKVSTIGVSAFDGCNSIKSVTITDSDNSLTTNDCFTYKSIEQLYLGRNIVGSFSANPNLASVELSDKVTSINNDMFLGCPALTQISLHDNISTIGANAFSGCVNLPAITIPAKVTTIGADAFEYCSALKAVTISDSDTKLNTNNNFASSTITTLYLGRDIVGTFEECAELSEVKLEYNITTINDSQFKNCSKITSIELPMYVSVIGTSAFEGCSALNKITLNDSITSIKDDAFKGCSALTSLTIPASVTTIGANAFDGCSALAELVIQDANTAISMAGNSFGTHPLTSLYLGRNTDCTFAGCATLSEVELGANVTTLNTSLFENCTNISSINLPQNLISIEANAFSGCTGLSDIKFNNSLNVIGAEAFKGCTALTSFVGPNEVTTIKANAFNGCLGLTELVIPQKVTSIGAGAFDGCSSLSSLILKSGDGEIDMNGNTFSTAPLTSIYLGRDMSDVTSPFSNITTLSQVIIGNGVTSLQSDAFSGCTAINELILECGDSNISLNCSFADSPITKVHIGRNGTYAFNNRIELKEVSVGDNVTSIPDNAFNGCSNVETLKLGNKLETIGTDAFIGCTTLTNVSSTNITPPTGASFENRTYMMGTLHVVKGYKEVYMQAKGWLDFFEIVDDLPFEVNNNWYLKNGDDKVKLVANPSGDSYIGNIFIPKSIEYNGETLFVSEIDADAFAGALSANAITIEDSESALTLTASQSIIETMSNDDVAGIFSDCMLDSVYVGRNLVYDIDNEPFANQRYLRKVTIGSCVTSMGGAMFVGCENIETVYAMGATPATEAEFESVVYDNAALIVPVGSINTYSETDGWKEFFSIKDTEGNITDPSGVENVKIADETDTHSTISVVNGEIIVNCAENIEIAIYNINGNLIYQGLNHQVAVATKGIYIVVVNGKAIKVLI